MLLRLCVMSKVKMGSNGVDHPLKLSEDEGISSPRQSKDLELH